MVPTLNNRHFLFVKAINEPMLLCNTARPITLEIKPQRYGFADACFGIPAGIEEPRSELPVFSQI
jgi:hypothetical protein